MTWIQESIARTRSALYEFKRRMAIAKKREREAKERTSAALELLIDDTCAELALPLTKENWPTISFHLEHIIADRLKSREDRDEWPGDDSWPQF